MKPKEASAERKQTNLESFLANTYRNCSEKFAKDLSKLIGKSKESFSLDKEDLVTVLTSNLTNTTKNIIRDTVKSCYRTLHFVSPKQTIYLADNFKGYRLLNELCKIVPGVLPSEQ